MESRDVASSDVFALFEAAHGAGEVIDPYPRWAELRRESPVHEGDLDPMVEAGAPSIFGDRPVFTALSYDAVAEVLRDSERFSTEIFNEVMGPVLGRVILGMDPIDHRLHRGLVQQAFSRARHAGLDAEGRRTCRSRPRCEVRRSRSRGSGE